MAKLNGIPETMLVTLYARAQATRQQNGIIHDAKALQIVSELDYDFSDIARDEVTLFAIVVRTEILDELVRDYIARNPDAQIVNLAAGLDARFYRVDNGQVRWIDLDLPEAIALRRRFIQETDRHRFVAASAFDTRWMQEIDASRPTLFIIEGLFMYFDEPDVRGLLVSLAEHFPGSEIVAEVIGATMAKKTAERSRSIGAMQAPFKWGIRDAQTMENWHDRLSYLTDISVYDRHQERWLEIANTYWPVSPHELRNTINRFVHLRIDT